MIVQLDRPRLGHPVDRPTAGCPPPQRCCPNRHTPTYRGLRWDPASPPPLDHRRREHPTDHQNRRRSRGENAHDPPQIDHSAKRECQTAKSQPESNATA